MTPARNFDLLGDVRASNLEGVVEILKSQENQRDIHVGLTWLHEESVDVKYKRRGGLGSKDPGTCWNGGDEIASLLLESGLRPTMEQAAWALLCAFQKNYHRTAMSLLTLAQHVCHRPGSH